jgi:uncharacterized protein YgbK (DUF1537 family)
MSGLFLAADDLTGALDSAVAFSARFGPIPVYLDVPSQETGVHAAVNLATRDASPELAERRSAEVLGRLSQALIPFKKIDSQLRGHWAVELAALMRSGGFRTCIFAPAFPGQGRVTRGGRQYLRAADRSERMLELDPVAEIGRVGLRVARMSPGEPAPESPAGDVAEVIVADAQSQDDLRAVVRWGSHLQGPVLWCGSGGLARALARSEPIRVSAVRRPVLAIVGSQHTVSQAQIAYASAWAPQRRVIATEDAAKTVSAIERAFGATGAALLTFALPGAMPVTEATRQIGLRLTDLLPRIPRPATLVIAGGETLLCVCTLLGATHLEVDAEFAPGVPRSRMVSGSWSGTEIISKSGAFGDATLLHRLLEPGP